MFEHANMFEHVNMLTYFSDTVTQVKPYGSFKNVLRAVKCTCEAPSVKKKKKGHRPDTWKLFETTARFFL